MASHTQREKEIDQRDSLKMEEGGEEEEEEEEEEGR